MSTPRWICKYTGAKCGPDRHSCLASFPHFLNLWPLTPSKCSLGLDTLMSLADVYSQMNLHTCVKFGPDRSSGLREDRRWLQRLVRFLATVGADSHKNTPKNNIYTSKIIIPARTCWHQRHYLSSQQFSYRSVAPTCFISEPWPSMKGSLPGSGCLYPSWPWVFDHQAGRERH